MKIGIIGLGVIGAACKYGFEKLGHTIITHDIKFNTSINSVLDTDICYICVPTPSDENGSCDVSIVESVVFELNDLNYKGVVAIKSTVKPTTTQSLINNTNLKICFVPEFLRERSATYDFVDNHDLLAVGTDSKEIYELIKKCHGNYPKTTEMLTPTEAEMLKYYSNTYNAAKIIFANEMYEICEKLNINYKKIKDTFVKRGTTIDSYLEVNENFRGYAGVCLPKDTKALDSFIKELGLDLKFFEVLDSENKKFKKTVFTGMRIE
jgi:nucleotide sugar dehydrogenase